ncbi:MAG: DUF4062 domain-containing protein [Cyclobacteriaceae bacterium]
MSVRVFIGSTSEDLKDYRQAAINICNKLEFVPIAMEFFSAMGKGANVGSKQKVDKSDLYVGIFAHRYGYIENGYDKSVTENEFDYAGERGLERLCFLVNPEFSWSIAHVDFKNQEALEKFKVKINDALIRSEFTTVDDFKEKLMSALVDWRERNPDKPKPSGNNRVPANVPIAKDIEHQQTERLLTALLESPETFRKEDGYRLLKVAKSSSAKSFSKDDSISAQDLKKLLLRIFNQNDNFRFDNAHTGYLNLLNNLSQGRRNRMFYKRIRANTKVKRIVAEGDSWFEHPIIYDVIDWLNELGKEKFAIYSMARGGDFLTNILEEREYFTELALQHPDVFLLSAGGVELVNGRRVALMLDKKGSYITEDFKRKHALIRDALMGERLNPTHQEKLERGMSFLSKEYFSLLSVLDLSYKYRIKQLRKQFTELKIITHGYDYPVPSYQLGPGIVKYLVNLIGGNGYRFKEPMLMRDITDEYDQRAICFAMVHLFNEMMINLIHDPVFGSGVYYVDCRGYAQDLDWHDEIHLRPRSLKQVAKTFMKAIENEDSEKKVFLVRQTAAEEGE